MLVALDAHGEMVPMRGTTKKVSPANDMPADSPSSACTFARSSDVNALRD